MSTSTSLLHHHHHRLLLSNPSPRSISQFPNFIPLTPYSSFPHSTISSPNPNPKPILLFRRRPHATTSSSISASTDLPFTFDHLLSLAELLCLASSAVASLASVLISPLHLGWNASTLGGGAATALVMAVAIGAWIRRLQWSRVSRENAKGGVEVDLFERIEKMEEDLRSSTAIVRVLSRQLEKLGIRFRVTRKALKEPIAEV